MFSTATKNAVAADVKNGAYRVGRDMRQGARNFASDVKSGGSAAHVEHIANDLVHQIQDYIERTRHDFEGATDRVTNKIRSNPMQSSLVALGVGVLVGMFIRK